MAGKRVKEEDKEIQRVKVRKKKNLRNNHYLYVYVLIMKIIPVKYKNNIFLYVR